MHLPAHSDVTAGTWLSRPSVTDGARREFLIEAASAVERVMADAFEANKIAEVATLHGIAALLRAAANDPTSRA